MNVTCDSDSNKEVIWYVTLPPQKKEEKKEMEYYIVTIALLRLTPNKTIYQSANQKRNDAFMMS